LPVDAAGRQSSPAKRRSRKERGERIDSRFLRIYGIQTVIDALGVVMSNVSMPTPAPQQTPASEGRQVLAVVAGIVVFYALIVVVTLIADRLLPASTEADGTISGSFIMAWILGAGIASAVGVEVAKWIAPRFNRVAFILLAIVPIALYAVAVFVFADRLSMLQLEASICALIGTAVGLGIVFKDLWSAKR
jgi:hypothetical protein